MKSYSAPTWIRTQPLIWWDTRQPPSDNFLLWDMGISNNAPRISFLDCPSYECEELTPGSCRSTPVEAGTLWKVELVKVPVEGRKIWKVNECARRRRNSFLKLPIKIKQRTKESALDIRMNYWFLTEVEYDWAPSSFKGDGIDQDSQQITERQGMEIASSCIL